MPHRLLLSLALPLCCSPARAPRRSRIATRSARTSGRDRASPQDESVTLPTAYEGAPALYMVGYVRAQFDLDRWTIGLTQVGFPVASSRCPRSPTRWPRCSGA